jgi:YHS domain-containing protein
MKSRALLVIALVLFVCTTAFAADAKAPTKLKKVEAQNVCMINEHAMGKPQVPVTVDGKTYYGCCEMCKKALAEDASKRKAKDALTGEDVDKAVAVIGADDEGKVYYFASEKNLDAYNAKVDAAAAKK